MVTITSSSHGEGMVMVTITSSSIDVDCDRGGRESGRPNRYAQRLRGRAGGQEEVGWKRGEGLEDGGQGLMHHHLTVTIWARSA